MLEIAKKELQTLAALGYCANAQGLHTEAKAIFDGLRLLRPKSEYPLIGLGVACIYASEFKAAIDIFQNKIAAINPRNPSAKAYLGMALKLDGQVQKGNAVLQEVIDEGKDAVALQLAKVALKADFKVASDTVLNEH